MNVVIFVRPQREQDYLTEPPDLEVEMFQGRIHLTVSPQVRPEVLALLQPEIGLKVAEAVDQAAADSTVPGRKPS